MLETPFRLLTRADTAILGGYSTGRCTWSWSHLNERRPEVAADSRENLAQGAEVLLAEDVPQVLGDED